CAAGDRDIGAYLTYHADRFVVAVARDDTGFKPVRQCFMQHLTHIVVKPYGPEVEHSLADRNKRRQLKQRHIDGRKAAGELFYDFVAEFAPRRLLISVGVHYHFGYARSRYKVDA